MNTYEITQVVEVMFTWEVRAANADAANKKASKLTRARCRVISKEWPNLRTGDITDDYIPARDA